MDEITFINETSEDLSEFELLYDKLISTTKEVLDIKQRLMLSVNFISEAKSLEMNQKYRDKSYLADVLSFPIDDEHGIYDQLDFKEIGDIFICYKEAKSKAKKGNRLLSIEMAWLFIHGLLHILGYDHEIESEAKEMFGLTDKILKKHDMEYGVE